MTFIFSPRINHQHFPSRGHHTDEGAGFETVDGLGGIGLEVLFGVSPPSIFIPLHSKVRHIATRQDFFAPVLAIQPLVGRIHVLATEAGIASAQNCQRHHQMLLVVRLPCILP